MNFQQIIATLPPTDGLTGLDIVDANGTVVHHIPPDRPGALRVYNALALRFDGAFSAEAAAQGLQWFAEHVAEARDQPGSHPNIDLLLTHGPQQAGWRLRPLRAA